MYENRTGRAITSVSYIITISEVGRENDEPTLRDVFYSESGRLVLRLFHDEDGQTMIRSTREPFLNVWTAGYASQPIGISSSEISQNEMYDIRVDILGMHNIRNLLPLDQIPRADFVWDPASESAQMALIVPEFNSIVVIMAATIGIAIAASLSNIRRIFRDGS